VELERVVMRAMAVTAGDRFPNITALMNALRPFAAPQGLALSSLERLGDADQAPPHTQFAVSRTPSGTRGPWRRPALALVLGLVALGLVALLWRTSSPANGPPAPAPAAMAGAPPQRSAAAPELDVNALAAPSASQVSGATPAPGQAAQAEPRPPHRRRPVASPRRDPPSAGASALKPAAESPPSSREPPPAVGRGRLKIGLATDQF
jgi:hypothetical protein